MTCPDRLGTEWREPIVRYRAGLKVSNVVWRVVHELRVADASLMRLLEPLELHLKEIQPFDVHHNGRLRRGMRRREIGSGEGAPQPMLRHHFIHPGKALEMVLVEQAR